MASVGQSGVRCGSRFSTYPDLFGRALRATRGLHELGIGGGDRVALLLRNSLEFLEASIATVPLGASAVPLNWHWRGDEIAYVLSDSGAKALVVHADLWPAIAPSVPDGIALIVVPTAEGPVEDPPAGALSWPEWLAGHEPWAQAPETGPASIIYTSGTTGRPKGVVRAQPTESQREQAQAMLAEIFKLAPQERTVIPAPMYHTAPNVYALAAAIRGMDMTIMTNFDAEEFLRIVADHRVTVVQMVPTMFVRLLALPGQVRSRYDLSSLRWVVHAAAPCPPDVKLAMIEWLGPIVGEYYGGTETGPVTFCTSEEWLAHPGTVGRPLERAVVKVLDADGYLYLNDRRSDMVISGGVNIYPAEIEACLLAMPGVRDCAVFGVPDDEFGEALAAYVEPQDGAPLSEESVREHVRSRLAAYKTPSLVEFRDSLPREDSGKIFKRRLRDPYWAGRERAI